MASDGRKSTGFFVKCVTGMFVLDMTTIYYITTFILYHQETESVIPLTYVFNRVLENIVVVCIM